MELILVIAIFVAGFFIGEAFTMYRLRKVLRDLADAVGINSDIGLEKPNEAVERSVPRLVTETHNQMIYLYERDTDTFICQANTITELAKLANEQKQIYAAVVFHGDKVFAFHNGTSQEVANFKV